MTKSTEWQRIGEVPVDTGRLVLLDPMNLDEVAHHEADRELGAIESMTYELITNEHDVAVALILNGLGRWPLSDRCAFRGAEGAVRIAEIRVRFLPHPVIGYELPR